MSNNKGIRVYNITEEIPVLITEIEIKGYLWHMEFSSDENFIFVCNFSKLFSQY